MQFLLLSIHRADRCTLKDVAGGFGTVFEVGSSWRARFLERAKLALAELPPVVWGHLAARLNDAGHSLTPRRVESALEVPRDARIVLVHTSLVDVERERSVMRELRATGRRVIAFGAAATSRPALFEDVADLVILGEPEVLEPARLVELLVHGRGRESVGEVGELDALPFPSWSRFPVESYRYALLTRRGPTLPIQSARGCPYGCGYCPWRVTASFRERSPQRVVDEARRDRDVFGARALSFRDPLFNLDADRVVRIAEGLAPLGLRWSAEMRADRLDASMLRALHRGGLRSLELGVESVDRSLLAREKRKPPSHEAIERVVRDASELGIRVICNYVLGLPGDTEATMRETIRWATAINSFAVQFTVATPYPGTSLEPKQREPEGRRRLTGFTPHTLEGAVGPDRLAELREWAYVRYHFRPRYVARFARQALQAALD